MKCMRDTMDKNEKQLEKSNNEKNSQTKCEKSTT